MTKNKMAITVVLLFIFFITLIAESGVKNNSKIGIKQLTKKCWQRQKAFEDTGNSSLCRDFEKVLNTTCESPEKLQCNWTLPPGEKNFKKLEWESVDWRNYWEFIEDLRKSGVREDMREELWKREESKVRLAWEKGTRTLLISNQAIDIDRDGSRERIIRDERLPEDKSCGVMLGVLQNDTKRMDLAYEHLFGNINASEGAEIMIYKGQAFMFGWDSGFKRVMVWQGFTTLTGKGSLNVCQFEYLKGGKWQ
ncbi:MAG: hypothetical protein PHN75_09880 [Syntrophales bacterium]|nr:hypothetical protein [Syntrophales bacterium]